MDQKRIAIEFLLITAVNVTVSLFVFNLNPELKPYHSAYFGGLAIMLIAVSAMFLAVGNMLGKNSVAEANTGSDDSQHKKAAARAIFLISSTKFVFVLGFLVVGFLLLKWHPIPLSIGAGGVLVTATIYWMRVIAKKSS